jgi:hypothetical protein
VREDAPGGVESAVCGLKAQSGDVVACRWIGRFGSIASDSAKPIKIVAPDSGRLFAPCLHTSALGGLADAAPEAGLDH